MRINVRILIFILSIKCSSQFIYGSSHGGGFGGAWHSNRTPNITFHQQGQFNHVPQARAVQPVPVQQISKESKQDLLAKLDELKKDIIGIESGNTMNEQMNDLYNIYLQQISVLATRISQESASNASNFKNLSAQVDMLEKQINDFTGKSAIGIDMDNAVASSNDVLMSSASKSIEYEIQNLINVIQASLNLFLQHNFTLKSIYMPSRNGDVDVLINNTTNRYIILDVLGVQEAEEEEKMQNFAREYNVLYYNPYTTLDNQTNNDAGIEANNLLVIIVRLQKLYAEFNRFAGTIEQKAHNQAGAIDYSALSSQDMAQYTEYLKNFTALQIAANHIAQSFQNLVQQ